MPFWLKHNPVFVVFAIVGSGISSDSLLVGARYCAMDPLPPDDGGDLDSSMLRSADLVTFDDIVTSRTPDTIDFDTVGTSSNPVVAGTPTMITYETVTSQTNTTTPDGASPPVSSEPLGLVSVTIPAADPGNMNWMTRPYDLTRRHRLMKCCYCSEVLVRGERGSNHLSHQCPEAQRRNMFNFQEVDTVDESIPSPC